MLKLVLPQGYSFQAGDYGRQYTFKIYTEDDAPFDATGYGLPAVKVFDRDGSGIVTVAGSWTAQNQGAGAFSFAQPAGSVLSATGPCYLEVQMEKSGALVSTERRRITVFPSP